MLVVYTGTHNQDLLASSEKTIIDGIASGQHAYLVCPSGAWAARRKEQLSSKIPFGLEVTTTQRLVKNLWDIAGDGRPIASDMQRDVLMLSALKEHNAHTDREGILSEQPVFVSELRTAADQIAGIDPSCVDGIDADAWAASVVSCIGIYRAMMMDANLVEPGEAIKRSDGALSSGSLLVFEGFYELPIQWVDFINKSSSSSSIALFIQHEKGSPSFKAASGLLELLAENSLCHVKYEEASDIEEFRDAIFTAHGVEGRTNDVIFARSSTEHVEAALLSDIIGQQVGRGIRPSDIRVCLGSANSAASGLVRELGIRGIPASFEEQHTLGRSLFGATFISVIELIESGTVDSAIRFACSPFSGFSRDEGWKLARSWRMHRQATAWDCIKDMRAAAARECAAKPVLDALSALAGGALPTPASSKLQTTADDAAGHVIDDTTDHIAGDAAARAVYDAADHIAGDATVHVPDSSAIFDPVLVKALVEAMVSAAEQERSAHRRDCIDMDEAYGDARAIEAAADVFISLGMPFDAGLVAGKTIRRSLASGPGCSKEDGVYITAGLDPLPRAYGCVIIAGMDNAAFPMAKEETPLESLVDRACSAKSAIRRIPMAERQRYEFCRAIEEASSTLVFECTRYTNGAEDVIPSGLYDSAEDVYGDVSEKHMLVEKSEARLPDYMPVGSAAARAALGNAWRGVPAYIEADKISEARLLEEMLAKITVFTPSSIETYLECPYRWFFERQLAPETIDQGFDAAEKGDYQHGLLKFFYERLTGKQEGAAAIAERVTPGNLDEALSCFDGCLEEYHEVQKALFPISASEEHEISWLDDAVGRFIASEATFLPGYHPYAFEYDFGGHDDGVGYAGAKLMGRVDRIDVDASGKKFVIVDYKSGTIDRYLLPSSGKSIYGTNIQAPAYATAVSRLKDTGFDGMASTASIYRSIYHHSVAGCWSLSGLGMADLASLQNARGAIPRENSKGAAPDEPDSYAKYLEGVEDQVAEAIERLYAGDIGPHPADGACRFCSAAAFCEKAEKK